MTIAYIALGANLGDRQATLTRAVDSLRELGKVTAISPLYETEPVGYRDQPRFLNAVVALDTELPATGLLARLQRIELAAGRTRTFRNAPRTLDLDLLLYGDAAIETPALTVPHPRMHERGFVLAPLAEIAPDVVHPVLQTSVSDLLAGLARPLGIERLDLADWPPESRTGAG